MIDLKLLKDLITSVRIREIIKDRLSISSEFESLVNDNEIYAITRNNLFDKLHKCDSVLDSIIKDLTHVEDKFIITKYNSKIIEYYENIEHYSSVDDFILTLKLENYK